MARLRKNLRAWILPAGLLILIVLPFIGIRYIERKGDRAWEEFLAKWEARGEKFELEHHLPTPIPDSENLARHPVMLPLLAQSEEEIDLLPHAVPGWENERFLTYRSDLNEGKTISIYPTFGLDPATTPAEFRVHLGEQFDRWSRGLDPLARAVHEREHLWYNFKWEEIFIADAMPDFSHFLYLANALHVRAAIRRGLEDSEGLLEDLETTFRIARAYRDIPLLLTLVYQAGLHTLCLDEIRAGLRENLFDAAQLVRLENVLSHTPSLAAALRRCTRMERSLILSFFASAETSDDPAILNSLSSTQKTGGIRRSLTKRWMNANRLALCQDQQELFLGRSGTLEHLRDWKLATRHRLENKGDGFVAALAHFTLANFGLGGIGENMFVIDAQLQRTRLVVALEHFRLVAGTYPKNASALVPDHLPALPTLDPGITIDYLLRPDGSWRLRQTVLREEPDDWTSQ